MVEGPSKRDPDVLSGRTRQNKLVHFPAEPRLAPGSIVEVEIRDAAPHFLRGALIEVLDVPTRRTRIPVVAV